MTMSDPHVQAIHIHIDPLHAKEIVRNQRRPESGRGLPHRGRSGGCWPAVRGTAPRLKTPDLSFSINKSWFRRSDRRHRSGYRRKHCRHTPRQRHSSCAFILPWVPGFAPGAAAEPAAAISVQLTGHPDIDPGTAYRWWRPRCQTARRWDSLSYRVNRSAPADRPQQPRYAKRRFPAARVRTSHCVNLRSDSATTVILD